MPQDTLLAAVVNERVAGGSLGRSLSVRPLPKTWRDPDRTQSLIPLFPYLRIADGREGAGRTDRERRVIDREDIQQLAPFSLTRRDGA